MFTFADEDMTNTVENGQKPPGKLRLFNIGQNFVVLKNVFLKDRKVLKNSESSIDVTMHSVLSLIQQCYRK